RFKDRILNIHPALLPAFKGGHAIKDAFDYGQKVTGVTVHFVDEKMDHGPIILQAPVGIEEDDTLESLEAKIHKLEHKLYPQAISLFAEGKLKIEGRRVRITPGLSPLPPHDLK
ncbi:MAG: formyltransferase family protein, partial [Candidatus Omnitrophica bacterium]|nr:formyltransferase family protein [Candidatus Omnitrophota bacterium]